MKQMEAKMRQQEKRNKAFIPPKEPTVSTATSKPSTDTSIDIDAFKAKIKKNTMVRKPQRETADGNRLMSLKSILVEDFTAKRQKRKKQSKNPVMQPNRPSW